MTQIHFNTKAVGQGAGLGLAIAHQIIVEKHGGKIYCDSTPNTARLSPKIPKYVGWVEGRNPTDTKKCWVSQSLNPTYEYP